MAKKHSERPKKQKKLRTRFTFLFAGSSLLPLVVIISIMEWWPTILAGEQALFFVGALFVVSVLFAIFFSSIASRSIVKPIEDLHKAAEQYEKGNFDFRISAETHDELGKLAETFNEMAEKVKQMYAREKYISDMKSEFISIAAHQMRTPLSAIRWTLNIIGSGSMGPLTEKQKDALRQGTEVSEHMIRLVNDLLNVSRIEEGRFGYDFKQASIIDVIEELIKEENIKAGENDVNLVFRKPKQKLPDMLLDTEKMRMALSNIIDNAIKYSLPGKSVDIGVGMRNNQIIVAIRDHGIGIPEKDIPRLFSKFFRAENALRLQTSGSGLGLYITKNIIEQHGGRLWAESKQNKGSIFYFSLPIHKEKKEEVVDEKEFAEFMEDL